MNLYALVSAGTNLLGTPCRLFEFGCAPQLEATPYGTWQILAATPFNYVAGAPDLDQIKTQIDIWAGTAAECRTVARAVRRAVDSACTVTFTSNSWDEESRLYRSTLHLQYSQEI